MKKNGKVEICGMHKGTWIRVEGEVKEDFRREARAAMMEENKVFCFEHGTATIYSFTADPKVIQL